jgi:hypothetical protein
MAEKPNREFGKRSVAAVQPAAPAKRSSHVALLLAGTFAVGGSAYALMPAENCAPSQPGMAAPSSTGCSPRGSSSGGSHGYSGGSASRSSFFSGDASSSRAGATASEPGSGAVNARRLRLVRPRLHLAFFRRRLTFPVPHDAVR